MEPDMEKLETINRQLERIVEAMPDSETKSVTEQIPEIYGGHDYEVPENLERVSQLMDHVMEIQTITGDAPSEDGKTAQEVYAQYMDEFRTTGQLVVELNRTKDNRFTEADEVRIVNYFRDQNPEWDDYEKLVVPGILALLYWEGKTTCERVYEKKHKAKILYADVPDDTILIHTELTEQLAEQAHASILRMMNKSITVFKRNSILDILTRRFSRHFPADSPILEMTMVTSSSGIAEFTDPPESVNALLYRLAFLEFITGVNGAVVCSVLILLARLMDKAGRIAGIDPGLEISKWRKDVPVAQIGFVYRLLNYAVKGLFTSEGQFPVRHGLDQTVFIFTVLSVLLFNSNLYAWVPILPKDPADTGAVEKAGHRLMFFHQVMSILHKLETYGGMTLAELAPIIQRETILDDPEKTVRISNVTRCLIRQKPEVITNEQGNI